MTDAGGVSDDFLSLEEMQRRHIVRVLEGVGGNKARAAEVLGIGRATIYQLLSRMKCDKEKHKPN
jgi:two-component system NtrC family response regulator